MRGQLLVVLTGFLEAGSSLQGGASGLQGGVRRERERTVRPVNSKEKGDFGKEGKGKTRNERNGGRNAKKRNPILSRNPKQEKSLWKELNRS